jgi:crotonobetainyl-CoA:carnitine CoA-transferase CaiB-like acyl-CoA transferase
MKPLQGIRVLDVTTFLAGPLTTRALADLGADVLKVEPPSGDPTRAGWFGGAEDKTEPSFYWQTLHGGRRSVVIDLTTPGGLDVFWELAAGADVVVENLRPGVTLKFGIDGPSLRTRFPRLVTCAITGFDHPELAGIAATDGPVQAWTGAVELMDAWCGSLLPMPLQAGDIAGGSAAAQGVLAALVARGQSGVGSHVDVSLEGALTQWMAVTDRRLTLKPPVTLVLTGNDGDRFLVQVPLRFAAQLRLVLGIPDDVPRDEIAANAQAAAETQPAAVWLRRLWDAGIPAAPVRSPSDDLARPPWTFDGDVPKPAGPPPALGANNGEGWL